MSSGTMLLNDRFEVVKDIGDGSFGTVVLAKVRSAGSGIARRGTLVCFPPFATYSVECCLHRITGCDQNHEEEIRVFPAVSGATRSYLFEVTTSPSPFGPCSRYFSRSNNQEVAYLYGVYGWESLPVDEGQGP